MSNQNATVNRVTLLESIEAARQSVIVCRDFHRLNSIYAEDGIVEISFGVLSAIQRLNRCAIVAAELEAWGDGP